MVEARAAGTGRARRRRGSGGGGLGGGDGGGLAAAAVGGGLEFCAGVHLYGWIMFHDVGIVECVEHAELVDTLFKGKARRFGRHCVCGFECQSWCDACRPGKMFYDILEVLPLSTQNELAGVLWANGLVSPLPVHDGVRQL